MTHIQLSQEQTASLCRGFALLLSAGIGTGEAARLLRREDARKVDQVLAVLEEALDQGLPLSTAIAETGAFPLYVPTLTRVGEESGRLEESLNALADYYEERCRTTRMLKSALAYPMLVFLVMLVVIGVLLVKVLPVFDRVYRNLGSRLTGLAGGLLELGNLLSAALPVLLALLAAGAVTALVLALRPALAEAVALRLRSRLGDRGILRRFNNAKFLRALTMGLESGLTPEESLELAEGLLTDDPLALARVALCRTLIQEGISLADALEQAKVIDPAAARLLSAGSRSGSEGQVLEQLTRQLSQDAEASLEQTVARVEPAMVLIASALVGIILLSTMLPLMNILSSIG